jgi:hypothetical protein
MRLRALLPAAVALLAPLAARAQSETVVASYMVRGCFSGTLRFEGGTRVTGEVACVAGPVDFVLGLGRGGPGVDAFRVVGSLSAAFNPEFTGASVTTESGFFAFTADFDGTPYPIRTSMGGTTGGSFETPTWVVGQSGPSTFRTAFEPIRPGVSFASIGDLRGMIAPRFRVPNAPPGAGFEGQIFDLTFTAIPEPSTFALGAVGGLALAAGALRRRRTPAG